MSWEIASIAGILGSGFLFLYASSIIDENFFMGRFQKFLPLFKTLALVFGLLTIIYGSTMSFHTFRANNSTMNANVSADIENVFEGNVIFTSQTTYTFVAFIVIMIVIYFFLEAAGLARNTKEKKAKGMNKNNGGNS